MPWCCFMTEDRYWTDRFLTKLEISVDSDYTFYCQAVVAVFLVLKKALSATVCWYLNFTNSSFLITLHNGLTPTSGEEYSVWESIRKVHPLCHSHCYSVCITLTYLRTVLGLTAKYTLVIWLFIHLLEHLTKLLTSLLNLYLGPLRLRMSSMTLYH